MINAHAMIVCGATRAEYSSIGAGALVRNDVPAYALMVAALARRIGWMCECGVRLPDSNTSTCADCGASYQVTGDGIRPFAPTRVESAR